MRDLELKLEKKELEALFVKGQKQHNKGKNVHKNQNSQTKGQGQGSNNSNRNSGRPQGQYKQQDRSTIKCNYCHKIGHLKHDCHQLKRNNNKNNFKDNHNSANFHEGYEYA